MTNKLKGKQAKGTIRFWDKHGQVTTVVGIFAAIECYIAGIDI